LLFAIIRARAICMTMLTYFILWEAQSRGLIKTEYHLVLTTIVRGTKWLASLFQIGLIIP
jgi:hypothetical protein